MRLLLASTTIALVFSLTPASAMCGGGQQASGGMCGASTASKNMSEKPSAEWPMAPGMTQAEQKPSTAMGSCPCCKNMAMMGGMKSDDPHKGMDMK
jgi:hypothetical protein